MNGIRDKRHAQLANIDFYIQNIKTMLDTEPDKRNARDILALSNEIKDIQFFKKYQDEGYDDDSIGDKFYLTLKGRVGIYIRLPQSQQTKTEDSNQIQLTCVKELEEGCAFGELALLNNKPRLASIKCHENCHFMVLEKKFFILILKKKEEDKLFKEMEFFSKLPFFEGWNSNLIKLIYLNSFRISYSKNEKVFSEGDEPISVYIVTKGEFIIQKEFDKNEEDQYGFKQTQFGNSLKKSVTRQPKQIPLSMLVYNEMFGEEDIMNQKQHRSYSVVCSTVNAECIVIQNRDFKLRILHEEGAKTYLYNRLAQKNSHMDQKIVKIKESIANFQDYLYVDRSESQQKLQISLAISKIQSPKKSVTPVFNKAVLTSFKKEEKASTPDQQSPLFHDSTQFSSTKITNSNNLMSPFLMKQKRKSAYVEGQFQFNNLSSYQKQEMSPLKLNNCIKKVQTTFQQEAVQELEYQNKLQHNNTPINQPQMNQREMTVKFDKNRTFSTVQINTNSSQEEARYIHLNESSRNPQNRQSIISHSGQVLQNNIVSQNDTPLIVLNQNLKNDKSLIKIPAQMIEPIIINTSTNALQSNYCQKKQNDSLKIVQKESNNDQKEQITKLSDDNLQIQPQLSMNLDSSFDLKFEPSKQEDIENNFKGLQSAVDCFSSLSPIRLQKYGFNRIKTSLDNIEIEKQSFSPKKQLFYPAIYDEEKKQQTSTHMINFKKTKSFTTLNKQSLQLNTYLQQDEFQQQNKFYKNKQNSAIPLINFNSVLSDRKMYNIIKQNKIQSPIQIPEIQDLLSSEKLGEEQHPLALLKLDQHQFERNSDIQLDILISNEFQCPQNTLESRLQSRNSQVTIKQTSESSNVEDNQKINHQQICQKYSHPNTSEDSEFILNNYKSKQHRIKYNSSFSPMRGRKSEQELYKFEKYKQTHYLLTNSKKMIISESDFNSNKKEHFVCETLRIQQDTQKSIHLPQSRQVIQSSEHVAKTIKTQKSFKDIHTKTRQLSLAIKNDNASFFKAINPLSQSISSSVQNRIESSNFNKQKLKETQCKSLLLNEEIRNSFDSNLINLHNNNSTKNLNKLMTKQKMESEILCVSLQKPILNKQDATQIDNQLMNTIIQRQLLKQNVDLEINQTRQICITENQQNKLTRNESDKTLVSMRQSRFSYYKPSYHLKDASPTKGHKQVQTLIALKLDNKKFNICALEQQDSQTHQYSQTNYNLKMKQVIFKENTKLTQDNSQESSQLKYNMTNKYFNSTQNQINSPIDKNFFSKEYVIINKTPLKKISHKKNITSQY